MEYPIRVAQVIGKMWSGGVESVVFNYYRHIDKSIIQFDFYYDADSTVEPSQELIDMGARFYKLPPYQKTFQYMKELRKHLEENQYHIVHSHLNTLSIIPLFAAWQAKIPVRIAHNHSVPGGGEFKRNMLKNILRCGAKIFPTDYFACSEKAGKWLFGEKAFSKGQVIIIKNAIDFNRFQIPLDVQNHVKEEYKLTDKFVVGHVGRFTYAKNHLFLLDIFAKIKKEQKDAVLLLVGDGELREEITEKAKQLGLTDSVVMTGKVSNPEIYYSVMNVFVMPSVFEGLGLAAIEAQASDIPVVLSEAIPQEAIICENCVFHDIKENADIWAQDAIAVTKKEHNRTENYNNYNINSAVKVLEQWYVQREKSIE